MFNLSERHRDSAQLSVDLRGGWRLRFPSQWAIYVIPQLQNIIALVVCYIWWVCPAMIWFVCSGFPASPRLQHYFPYRSDAMYLCVFFSSLVYGRTVWFKSLPNAWFSKPKNELLWLLRSRIFKQRVLQASCNHKESKGGI